MSKFTGRNCRGSLTIFAALSFMLISQFIFIMIEAARYVEIDKITEIQSRSELESLFAEYCKPLWEEYHLLGMQLSEEEMMDQMTLFADLNSMEKSSESIWGANMNLIRTSINDITVDSFEVMTDDNGGVYEAEVVSYMKKNITYELARKLYDEYSALESLTGSSDYSDSYVDDAMEVIENKDDYQIEEESSNATPSPLYREDKEIKSKIDKSIITTSYGDSAEDDTTLEDIQASRSKGILTLVLDSDAQNKLSSKSINGEKIVSKRELNTGRNVSSYDESWMDKILLELYMENYMSSYLKPANGRALTYEYEYLLSGKSSDIDNLKSVVNQILLIREAVNFVYILADVEKMEETAALAAAIGGASLNPLAIAIIQAGLIAAWAYCESILDVRALLDGDRIPYIKSPSTWTSSLENISTLLDGNVKAISDPYGSGYGGYLGFLFMLKNRKDRTYRAMDLQELCINMKEGYENVKMDSLICSSTVSMRYDYNLLFLDFINLINPSNKVFGVKKSAKYSYI